MYDRRDVFDPSDFMLADRSPEEASFRVSTPFTVPSSSVGVGCACPVSTTLSLRVGGHMGILASFGEPRAGVMSGSWLVGGILLNGCGGGSGFGPVRIGCATATLVGVASSAKGACPRVPVGK